MEIPAHPSLAARQKLATYPTLAGRRVVVTGGATGIGAGLVEAFVAQDSEVHFLDVQESEAAALIEGLSGAPRSPRFHFCDLTKSVAISAAFEAIGAVDVLVNNAGSDDRHALADVDDAYFDDRMAINLRHYVLCARAAAPAMTASGRGAIINLGSIAWRLGLPALSIYEAAKAGIEGFTRGLARDLGPMGVRVNCIAPGNVRTARQMRWYPTS